MANRETRDISTWEVLREGVYDRGHDWAGERSVCDRGHGWDLFPTAELDTINYQHTRRTSPQSLFKFIKKKARLSIMGSGLSGPMYLWDLVYPDLSMSWSIWTYLWDLVCLDLPIDTSR